MKNKKIDELFKNKLVQHEVAPRADAWGKLEGKMATKKTGYMVYWRVAAVFLLLITTVFALYDFDDVETTVATTEEETAEENKMIDNNSEAQLADAENSMNEEIEVIEEAPKQIIKRKAVSVAVIKPSKKQQEINLTTQKELVADNDIEKEDDLVKENMINLIDKGEDNKTLAVTESTNDIENKSYDFGPKVVITFKKDKVEEKEEVASVKGNENKKRKLFRKVLNFAKELKSKNIGIASIREAKDEIFTSRSKKKTQNVNQK